MIDPVERAFSVGDVVVSAYYRGGHDTVVFVHGLGCTKESLLGAFRAPELAEFGLCAIDLPGHGASTVPRECPVTVELCAEVLDTVLAELGGGFTVVGHSLGGAVGLLSRARFRRFVSVEGNLSAADCGVISRQIAEQSLSDFRGSGFSSLVAELARPGAATPPELSRWLASCDPTALHQIACSLVSLSDSGRLLRLYIGLRNQIYVYGDSAGPPHHVLPALAGTPTRNIPDSGHFPMVDNPARFYALIAEIAEAEED